MPPEAADLIPECGQLPLALSMIGAMLRSKPHAYWSRVLDLLGKADLEKIKAQFSDYLHSNLFRAIRVSVDALEPIARERYLALGVLLKEHVLPYSIQQTLWNVEAGEALETAKRFVSVSLAQRNGNSCPYADLTEIWKISARNFSVNSDRDLCVFRSDGVFGNHRRCA